MSLLHLHQARLWALQLQRYLHLGLLEGLAWAQLPRSLPDCLLLHHWLQLPAGWQSCQAGKAQIAGLQSAASSAH